MGVLTLPSRCALIQHSRLGPILFDAGYAERVLQLASRGATRLYAAITPMSLPAGQSLRAQLAEQGVAPTDVRLIILSHFHADHVGGIVDFPHAQVICAAEAWHDLVGCSRLHLLRRAVLPELLGPQVRDRLRPLMRHSLQPAPPELLPFTDAWDVFADQTIWAVPLPGHAIGHMGLYMQTPSGPQFLVGDACWTVDNLIADRLQRWPARFITADNTAYRQTWQSLRHLQADGVVKLVASHDTVNH